MRKTIFSLLFLALPLFSQQALFFGGNHNGSVLGSLSGSVNTSTTSANLTTAGTSDWIEWGAGIGGVGACPGTNRKSSGGSQISAYTLGAGETDNLATTSPPTAISLTWTGGTPTATASSLSIGCFANPGNISKGYTFTAPCGTASRTLLFYGFGSGTPTYNLTASLSDGSSSPYSNGATGGAGDLSFIYTLVYNCASNGQTINLAWTSSAGNIGVEAAALQ